MESNYQCDCSVTDLEDVETPQPESKESSSKFTPSSVCDFLDATDRNYFVKLWAKLSAKKTSVERDSIERQYETAREALMGKIPPHHTILFQRGLVPAPVINGLHYFTALELQKSVDLSEASFKTPFRSYSSEKSGKGSHIIKTYYSTLFHAYRWSEEISFQPPEGSSYSHVGSGISESEVARTLKGLHKESFPYEKVSAQHRRHTISGVSQPGLNTKVILPPIPQGRKWTSG